jgi:peptidoglycan/LPS O-acetylase OafA/YrhL
MTAARANRATGFYSPELDGLRWFAVVGVMIAHFSWTLSRYMDWGAPGVRLFFVLSGFLITHLLLRARERCDTGEQSRGLGLSYFFVRRVFRLWPLYFASLAIAYAFHVHGTESPFAWHALFATNLYIYQYQTWPALLSHYWTLAVEQQFYVIWPFVVLFLPLRWLPGILGALIVMGPLMRGLPLALGFTSPDFTGVLLPACLDFFALGSMIAWWWRGDQLSRFGSRQRLQTGLAATAGWLLLGAFLRTTGRLSFYWSVYDGLLQGLGFALLIVYFLRFPDSRLAVVARWRPFVYLGQISYGLYTWHNLMHRFGPSLTRRLTGEAYFKHEAAQILFFMALTIVTAVVSYHAFESPVRWLGQKLSAKMAGRGSDAPGRVDPTVIAVAAPKE